MELAVMDMPKTEARKAFLAYRNAVREHKHSEMTELDAQLMRGYRALSQGKQVLSLQQTIIAGGFDTSLGVRFMGKWTPIQLPRLAIARANQATCWTKGVDSNGVVQFNTDRDFWRSRSRQRITVGGMPIEQGCAPGEASAIVPIIPPDLRPAHDLGNYHVLWEADWRMTAPRDPALLRHIGGDLWAVLATWDLTELERAVLVL